MAFQLTCDMLPMHVIITAPPGLPARDGGPMFSQRLALSLLLAGGWALSCARAGAAEGPTPCASNPALHQLDYWLGKWSVDSGRGRSDVHLSLDKCEVVEAWASNATDHRGENTLVYNSEEKTWYGLFVDNRGRAHMFTGTVTDGSAQFQGPGLDENGKTVMKRVRVVRVNPQTVDQLWEKSADNGVTWATDFKMEYLRKTP